MRSVAHLPSCNHARLDFQGEIPPSPISPAFSGQCLSLAAPVCNWIYWVESPQVLSHKLIQQQSGAVIQTCAVAPRCKLARQKMATQDDRVFSLLQRERAVAKLCIRCLVQCWKQIKMIYWYCILPYSPNKWNCPLMPAGITAACFFRCTQQYGCNKKSNRDAAQHWPNPTYCSDQD